MDRNYDDLELYFDYDKDRYGDTGYNPDLLTEKTVYENKTDYRSGDYKEF